MKRFSLACVCILITLVTSGCLATPTRTAQDLVEFGELVAHPQRYGGKQICTEGIYATGFETNALGRSTREVADAVYLTGPTIWIEGADVRVTGDCLEAAGIAEAEFCPAEVCGVFDSGGQFGHLGGYAYQIRGPGQ